MALWHYGTTALRHQRRIKEKLQNQKNLQNQKISGATYISDVVLFREKGPPVSVTAVFEALPKKLWQIVDMPGARVLPGQSQTAHWCEMPVTLCQQKPDTRQVHRNACCKKRDTLLLKFSLTQNKQKFSSLKRQSHHLIRPKFRIRPHRAPSTRGPLLSR